MGWTCVPSAYNDLNRAEPSSITSNSVFSRLRRVDRHLHNEARVYPTLAAGVTVTGAAGAWTLGSLAEVVPASTITSAFDIHGLVLQDLSAVDDYEVVLYAGAGDTEVGRVRISRTANQDSPQYVAFRSEVIAANSRIRAACASAGGGSDTLTLSIDYHVYD